MPVSTKYNELLDVVEATWTGTITKQELTDATEEHLGFHTHKGVQKFLNDFSSVERLSLSMADLYELPNKKYEESNASRMAQIALIKPSISEVSELIEFYVTACMNRGWSARVFKEYNEAIEWLGHKQNT